MSAWEGRAQRGLTAFSAVGAALLGGRYISLWFAWGLFVFLAAFWVYAEFRAAAVPEERP